MRAVPLAQGFSAVVTPGEPEQATAAVRRCKGVPLAPATWDALLTCASQVGVAIDAPAPDDETRL